MSRLDRDQECYDFTKWYQTVLQASDYDFGDMGLPFLSVEGADVLEDAGFTAKEYSDAHHCSARILLKLKLLSNIINIRLTRKVLNNRLPVDLLTEVELAAIQSPLSITMTKTPSLELVVVQGELVRQLRSLGACLRESNDNVDHRPAET